MEMVLKEKQQQKTRAYENLTNIMINSSNFEYSKLWSYGKRTACIGLL